MKQAKSKMLVSLVFSGLGACMLLSGCTVTPKAVTDSAVAPTAEPVCHDECAQDDSTYQYYLGVLSVLIMG